MADPATARPKKAAPRSAKSKAATPVASPQAPPVPSQLDISSTLQGAAFSMEAQRITRERVRQIEKDALKKLRRALAERGFTGMNAFTDALD